jgi:hypothetical protein
MWGRGRGRGIWSVLGGIDARMDGYEREYGEGEREGDGERGDGKRVLSGGLWLMRAVRVYKGVRSKER